MDCLRDTTIKWRGHAMKRLLSVCLALCLPAAFAPAFAQTTATKWSVERLGAFQERVEAVARNLAGSPPFKDLTQQQRVDRVEFVVGNTLFVLLHEMGHAYIRELELPVLGRAEDAADEFAVLTLINRGSAFSHHVLVAAAKGWFLSDRRNREIGEPTPFYDEHELNAQRAYRFVCLMVGSDPRMFADLAREVKLPDERQKSCKEEYEIASRSWETLLKPYRRVANQPRTQIDVIYGDGEGDFDALVKTFRGVQLLETVAGAAAEQYAWPTPFRLEMQVCGYTDAEWNEKTRVLTVCYDEARDFVELYRAYGASSFDVSYSADNKSPLPAKRKENQKPHTAISRVALISGNPSHIARKGAAPSVRNGDIANVARPRVQR